MASTAVASLLATAAAIFLCWSSTISRVIERMGVRARAQVPLDVVPIARGRFRTEVRACVEIGVQHLLRVASAADCRLGSMPWRMAWRTSAASLRACRLISFDRADGDPARLTSRQVALGHIYVLGWVLPETRTPKPLSSASQYECCLPLGSGAFILSTALTVSLATH